MRSIASWSRAFPSDERCDRPSESRRSRSSAQPGGFGQGPEEKEGLAGRVAGLVRCDAASVGGMVDKTTLLAESTRRVGTAWPARRCSDRGALGKPGGEQRFGLARGRNEKMFPRKLGSSRHFSTTHRSIQPFRPVDVRLWLNLLTKTGEFHPRHERGVFSAYAVGAGDLLHRR